MTKERTKVIVVAQQKGGARFCSPFRPMEEVHRLIRLFGIEQMRRQAVSKRERQVVETAHQVLSDDAERIGFSYSGFALTSLPHKPVVEQAWKREGHNLDPAAPARGKQ